MTSSTNNSVRAVVLAAGQGKRMKSARAKVLHDVLGKPILARILDALDKLGTEKIHVVIGHGAAQIVEYLDTTPPATPCSTHVQEPQLGTGHALQQVAPDLTKFSGTLLVTVGDAPLLTTATLSEFIAKHKEDKAVLSLLTTYVDNPKNYGRIVRDLQGQVAKIVEDKDATEEQKRIREINPAIYCLEWPKVAEGLNSLKNDNKQKEYYLTDLVAWAHDHKLAISSLVAMDWREVAAINSRAELAEATSLLRDRTIESLMVEGVTIVDTKGTWIAPEAVIGNDTTIMPGCYITGDVSIGSNCVIGPNTVIHGPVKIGERTTVAQSLVVNSQIGSDCKVGPFSHLREHTVVGDKCRVGNFVEIKKSTIAGSTNASHLSYVGDATVGTKVNIGAGTITANYNHLTGKKFSTVIEDGASTGSNSVLVAPIKLGKRSSVGAGTVATKDVPDGALAVGRARQENKEGWSDRQK
ncbi:MAG TPA: bifunctional UDP-N-acetylglucosamine diphosphorylase/glucosamine-1-phosphate N-acetyltransferase GlmU [Candidatus Obscuribacterales bacterium]